MNGERAIVIVGIVMFLAGLVMFYPIERGHTEPLLGLVKNAGTFIGLSGVGVIVAGMLLLLIRRNTPPLQEGIGT